MLLPNRDATRDRNSRAIGHETQDRVRNSREERQRSRIVWGVLIVYFLLVTEGVLRKWVLPTYSQILFFVRDPVVIAIYLYAVMTGLWPKRELFLNIGVGFGVLALMLAAIQLIIGVSPASIPGLLAGYGWRNYFLYLPLPFLIGTHFRSSDIAKLANLTFLLAVPIAVLVFLQFHSPGSAKINMGVSDDLAYQFVGLHLVGEHIRPMGTFTSDIGQGHFTVLTLAACFVYWFSTVLKPAASRALATVGTLGVLVCLLYCGSRTAVLASTIVLVGTVFGTVRAGDAAQTRRLITGVVALAALATVGGLTFAADGVAAFLERWQSAYAAEHTQFVGGFFGRALWGFVAFTELIFRTPVLGYGLGIGGNASTTLGVTISGFMPLELAETDWSRHILDLGPVIGFMFIAYRIALVTWLASRVLRTRSLAAYTFFSVVALDLTYGQITGHGSLNGFAWITAGLCLAATRPVPTGNAAPRARLAQDTRRFPNILR